MANSNDVIQLTTKGDLFGQEVLNVWYYIIASDYVGFLDLQDIASAWFIEFDTNVLTFLSQELTINQVDVLNLTDGLEFYSGSVTANGDNSGDCLPTHDAISVRLNRQTRLTRSGRKSFAGVPESVVTDGEVILTVAQVQQIETFCGEPLELSIVDADPDPVFLNPVIIGRTLDINGVYQLDLAKINFITSAKLNRTVSTQNTRKR